MKQPRIMQTIKNGRRIPLDAEVIIFPVKWKEKDIGIGRGRDEELIHFEINRWYILKYT